jgi:hypothetical protein
MTCTSGATSLVTDVPSRGAPLPENSYEAAGVSIERGEQSVDLLRPAVEKTHGPEVLGAPGGFAGLYALTGYRDPVLASTIDGVGTKVLVAREVGRYSSLGADIVNHCVNDVLATGARPLFFLDYVATGRLDPEAVAGIVSGAAEACKSLGVALIGGETAEMPGIYGRGDFEIVGVCVGACERSEVVGGEQVQPGDTIIGLASSGLHTNGYTLARKVIEDAGLTYHEVPGSGDGARNGGWARGEPTAGAWGARSAARRGIMVRTGGLWSHTFAGRHTRKRDAQGLQPRRWFLRCRAPRRGGGRARSAKWDRLRSLADRGGHRSRGRRVCLSVCPKARASPCWLRVRGRTCRLC